jgi:hypothetical protein
MAGIPVKVYELSTTPPQAGTSLAAPTMNRVTDFVARLTSRTDTIPSEALRNNLGGFLEGFGEALGGIPTALSGYHLEEIELSLEIGAKGEVHMIVGSAEIEGTAGVKLTLKRAPSS